MAVYLVWLVATYMRPNEPLKILKGDVVQPVANVSREWLVNLFPEERDDRSKTYAANDSVSLHVSWAPWFQDLLPALVKGRADEPVFDFSYPTFLEIFMKALRRLGLPPVVPYEARRSVPAIDVSRNLRTRQEVKERGRWKSDKSVQRYEQLARRALSFFRLGASLQTKCRACKDALGDVLLGRRPPDGL